MNIINIFRNTLLYILFIIVIVSIFLSFGLVLVLYEIIQNKKELKKEKKNDR